LKLFAGEKDLEAALERFAAANKPHLGLVSLAAPLISNLSVCNNITLIPQYHRNMPRQEARSLIFDLLGRFDLAAIAEKRNPALTAEERFCGMLLRAAMVQEAVVVLDRPFSILTHLRNGVFLWEALRKVDDLIAEVDIFDYSWQKERYGVTDDLEN
jgi:ABC-type nitrate/sulfonate/bicarbonate transport system ATPase subunit